MDNKAMLIEYNQQIVDDKIRRLRQDKGIHVRYAIRSTMYAYKVDGLPGGPVESKPKYSNAEDALSDGLKFAEKKL